MKEDLNNKTRRAYDVEINERSALNQKFESIDDVLPFVGNFGRYQWYLLLALFPYSIVYANLYFSTFFLTLVPQEYWCSIPELQDHNLTMEQRVAATTVSSNKYPYYERCYRKDLNFHELLQHNKNFHSDEWKANATIKCDKWEYNLTQVPYRSISSELDWVCDKEYLISSSQAIFFCGSIFGAFIFGWIADHKGRVPALVLCSAVACLGTIATAWSTSFWSFAACRFITGFAFDNCINIPLIVVVEYMAVNRRTLVFNIAFGIHFALGSTILPWVAYYIADWRHLAYIVATPMLINLFTPWILPESARWYASTDQWDKVVENLKHIAKVNKKNPDPRIYETFLRNAQRNVHSESATLLDLFKTPRLARTTILLIIFWTLTIICFDGHVYSLKLLQSSVFVSFSLASSTELPAGILVTLILDRWGRRFCGFLTLGAIGICSFTELYSPSTEAKLASSVLARFSGNMAANIGLQYAAELLPTPVRAQGVALVHLFGIFAHAIAPYIIDLANVWEDLPMILLGTSAFITATLVLFLPETQGRSLPQTLQQGEDFGKDSNFWSFPCCKKSNLNFHDDNENYTIE
ncbi:carcinine transporter-like [Chelonus insularis]|uniref:carcinine transporter-like n=1 Tax=Chelonus insularis TaxID=460826 RepID=UPI00158B0E59|nr:carcinine transporter-like [Chelonus insularis]XP_034942467.1 carcinine transporter-like [Chelonus insularis]